MYKSFFKFAREPFEISPDPYFLYLTAQHNEALAGIYYGISARKGFMVLTGEVGAGKTLVVRCVLDLLDKRKVLYAYVFNSRLSSRQFLEYLAEDLGVSYRRSSKSDLLLQLSSHLMNRYRQGLTTALLVDEAQHLSTEVLEEIRLLSNLETPQGKLLQIVLVGQAELDTKLESHALRQLKQRVALRFHLQPLSELQTRGYVERRLKMAGENSNGIFSLPALQRVFRYSSGIPRVVNILCDNALTYAYALGQAHVTPSMIDEVASDLRLKLVDATPDANSAGVMDYCETKGDGAVRSGQVSLNYSLYEEPVSLADENMTSSRDKR